MESGENNSENVNQNSSDMPVYSEIVVVDGLLCSVIKALSTTTDDTLVTALESGTPEVEIKDLWWKLFNFFDEAVDEVRKLKVKDIKRQSKKAMIEDIVKHLRQAGAELGQAQP